MCPVDAGKYDSFHSNTHRYQKSFAGLWAKFPMENTLLLASEQLEQAPAAIWRRIAAATGLSPEHPHLKEFKEVRYNAQVRIDCLVGVSG